MFIITGLNGELKQQEDITKRIKQYIKNKKYEELLSLVVIHHGKDLFDIIKPLKNEIKIDNDMLGFYFKNIVENCNEETEKEYKIDLELGALEYEYQTRVEKMNKLIESKKFKNISVDVINKYCNMENVLKFCNDFLHQNVFEGYKNEEKNFEKIYENFQKEAKVLKEMENLTEEKRTSCIIFVIKREKEKFCKKVENFKEEFEQKYLQNEIKNREDFETIGEWKKEKEKLIDNLIIDCIENELPNSEKLFEIKEMSNSLSFGSNHPFSSSSTFSIGESSTSTTKGWPLNNAEMAIMREYFSHDDSMQLYSDNDSLSNNELNEGNNSDESELLELDLHPHQQNYPPEAEVINIDKNTSPPSSPNSSSEESDKFVKHKNLKNEIKQKEGENKIFEHSTSLNNPNSSLFNLQPLQNKSHKKRNLKRSQTV
ncbi:hypothetical protein Mgra_00010255 [Meloidogyne graminicola]|uniref:Uncharacterized protein n=1 Tax=Meloidogyne graminicola TaxID=189291 RepID=A0A8S9ZD00_9BILA|nr:hypothetical protein Mgra_00010255 [Meloidogyne graminicola]